MTDDKTRALLAIALLAERNREVQPLLGLNATLAVLLRLQKLAAALHRRYEAKVSAEDAQAPAYDEKTLSLEKEAFRLSESIGLKLGLQKDPRGWPFVFRIGDSEYRLG